MILDVEEKKKETITGFLSFGFITDKLSFNRFQFDGMKRMLMICSF